MSGGVWWSSLSSLLSPSSPSYPVSCVPSVPFKSFEKSWEFWGSEIPLLGPTCQVHLVLDAIASPSSYPCGWVGQSVSGWVGGVIAVHTSDPLLDVVEWISYSTEVSCFHMRDVVLTSFFHTSFFTQVGPIVIAAWLLFLSILLLLPLLPWLPFLLQYLSFQHVVCPQVPALDVERLHPHPLTCILLLLHDKEDKHPSLAPGEDH